MKRLRAPEQTESAQPTQPAAIPTDSVTSTAPTAAPQPKADAAATTTPNDVAQVAEAPATCNGEEATAPNATPEAWNEETG